MPTLFIEGPYRVYFTSHDRPEPPHVHVERDGLQLKIWLNPLQIAHNSGLSQKEAGAILKIIKKRKNECEEKWNEYFRKN